MFEVILITYGIAVLATGIVMTVTIPMEDGDGLRSTLSELPGVYKDILKDFDHLVCGIGTLITIFIFITLTLAYLVVWVLQFRFLFKKGWN